MGCAPHRMPLRGHDPLRRRLPLRRPRHTATRRRCPARTVAPVRSAVASAAAAAAPAPAPVAAAAAATAAAAAAAAATATAAATIAASAAVVAVRGGDIVTGSRLTSPAAAAATAAAAAAAPVAWARHERAPCSDTLANAARRVKTSGGLHVVRECYRQPNTCEHKKESVEIQLIETITEEAHREEQLRVTARATRLTRQELVAACLGSRAARPPCARSG
eukprot:scaffold60659_cov57-Phaeocystis_antarctica.AAC.2